MPTLNLNLNWSVGGRPVAMPLSLTDDGTDELDVAVNDGVVDQLANINVVVAKTTAVLLFSSRDLTVKTNSASTPQESIALVGGVPLLWHTGCGFNVPFAGDVTAFYLSNSSGQQATLRYRRLYHT